MPGSPALHRCRRSGALGFQQSRYSYGTQARVMEIADRLRADQIPADAIYLDIDYQKNNRPFTVDPDKFPALRPDDPGPRAQGPARRRDHRPAHRQTAEQWLCAVRLGHGRRPLRQESRWQRVYGHVWPGPSVFPDFTQKPHAIGGARCTRALSPRGLPASGTT